MKSKWIYRLLLKQQGAYHFVNLYTYWSKLSSQWLVNSSKASCSLRLLRGVPITNGESAKYSSLVWLFSTQSTQEAILFYGGRGFRQQGFLRWKNYTWLEGKNRFMSFRINSAIYWYICRWTKLVSCNLRRRPLVRTCCMPCQLRSVPSNLSRANALKKRRAAAPALWTLAKMHISFPELFVLIF